jgi:pimeloyl-ACP methyl ester carboxylesterase
LTGAVAPLSVMTFEANPVYTRPTDRVYPWRDEVEAINTRFTEAVATGDPDAAAIIIDYWSTKGAFTAMPPVFQDYCRATVQSNVLDWGGAADFAPAISAFGAVDVPATLVRGAHANAAIADITADIAQALPQGAMEVVEGAGHFLISTHPEACAALIDAHMGRIAARIAASSSGGPG